AKAVDPDPEHHHGREREDRTGGAQHLRARVLEPALPADRLAGVLLEVLEVAAVDRPVLDDAIPELRQAFRAGLEHAGDDGRDILLERSQAAVGSRRELEISDRLVPQAAPELPLRRDGLRRVAAAPDQIEERRGELERAGADALPKQRWNEGRSQVAGRFLLVLAVVHAPALAAERGIDAREQRERRAEAEREQNQDRPAQVIERVPDL